MLSSDQNSSPRTLHIDLIKRIKQKLGLGLGRPESTFLSRKSILEYYNILNSENSELRDTMDPPDLSPELAVLQQKCNALRYRLVNAEQQQRAVMRSISTSEEEINFIRDQIMKNNQECQELEHEISLLNEQRSLEKTRNQEEQQVTHLMDKLLSYFQAPEYSESQPQQSIRNSASANLLQRMGLEFNRNYGARAAEGKTDNTKSKEDRLDNSDNSFNAQFQKLLQLDLSQQKLKQRIGQ